ncbi:DMT family transporter [Pelagibacteraceae bacterium]|nr:DMT family transporter [Pelagibacteraceae bacterium]
MQSKHLILVLIIMILYGSSYPVGKLGIDIIPPLLFTALRLGLIFLAFLPFFRFKLPEKNLIKPLIGFSLAMGIGTYVTMYYALEQLSIVAPIIIGAQLSIPFGLILSLLFLKENISIKRWFLIFLSFIGIVIIAYDPRIINDKFGLALVIVMAFFYAVSNLMARVLKEVDTATLNGWHGLIAFIPIAVLTIIIEGNPINYLMPINGLVVFTVLHTALIVSVIGHAGMFYLYKFYPISNVLPFYSLFPIFGLILAFIIFAETLSIHEIVGGVLILGSVFFIHKENKKDNA